MSKPLPDDIPNEQKVLVLKRRNEILCCVKEKINEKLDPSKPDYDSNTSAEDMLAMCKVSKNEYNWALSILQIPILSCILKKQLTIASSITTLKQE